MGMQKKIIKSSIILLIIFIIGVLFIGLNKSSIYDTKNLVGQKINKIQLEHFSDNKKVITGEDLKEQNFTLINFWASWCGPCRDEHSMLLRLNQVKNLHLLGVNFKDKKNNALEFLRDLGNPYDDLARDELGKHSINFGIYGIPESILINKDLVIIKKFIGPISHNDYNYIKKIVKE